MNIFFLLLSFALAYTPPEEKPSFSQMEINHIRVTTPGLFDNENLLELHLEQIPDTAYCFPLPGGKRACFVFLLRETAEPMVLFPWMPGYRKWTSSLLGEKEAYSNAP